MPYLSVDARRANRRAAYARRRNEMRALAAQRRADPEFRERARRYAADWRVANPDRRKHLDLRVHGLSVEEYRALEAAQGGVCAVCGRPETRRHQSGAVNGLAVDHDHATGKVRGLLCGECNMALGKLGDDPGRMRAAAAYIERSRA